jgi:hypothetical protein
MLSGAERVRREGQDAFGAGVGVELELDEEPEPLEVEPPVDGAGELLFSAGLAEDDEESDESFLAAFSAESDDLPLDSARESLR